MGNKYYEETDIQNIASAIRQKNPSAPQTMKVRDMDQAILDITGVIDFDIYQEPPWERPAHWPDLDSLWQYDPHDNGTAWFTYIKTEGSYWGWGMFGQQFQVDVGYLDDNGSFFITDTKSSITNYNETLYGSFPEEKEVMLIRVTSTNDAGVYNFAFNKIPKSVTGKNYDQPAKLQCCYEAVGCLPNASIINNADNRSYVTQYIEHINLSFGNKRTLTGSNAGLCSGAINLRRIDFNNFDTSLWKLSNIDTCFKDCWKLQELDFTGIDTSNWSINSVSQMFSNCYLLRNINFADIDTSNWFETASRADNVYYKCYSLKELDLSFRKMDGSIINTVSCKFYRCFSLKKITFGDVDTSNWTLDYNVSSMANVFYDCVSLEEIDLSHITFDGINRTLKYSFNDIFAQCCSLKKIILSDAVNTQGIMVKTATNIVSRCFSLQKIENLDKLSFIISSDVSTDAYLVYLSDYLLSVKEIVLPNIIADKNIVNTGKGLQYFCRYLCSAEKIDLSAYDNETAQYITPISGDAYFRLKEFRFPKYLSNGGTWFNGCYTLEEIYPPENGFPNESLNFSTNVSVGNPNRLSVESVHRIINALPQATGSKTCTLGNAKQRLTTEDIAIASQKGWTIA